MSSVTREAGSLPRSLKAYLLLAGFLGLGALAGGGALIADPTGASIQLSNDWLAGSPFADYLVPGIVLFAVFGIGSFVVCGAVLLRRRWSWYGAIGLGVALLAWLAVQIAVIERLSWLHALYAGIAIGLVLLAARPTSRAALAAPDR